MYDTAIRVALVKQRVRENTRWMMLTLHTSPPCVSYTEKEPEHSEMPCMVI